MREERSSGEASARGRYTAEGEITFSPVGWSAARSAYSTKLGYSRSEVNPFDAYACEKRIYHIFHFRIAIFFFEKKRNFDKLEKTSKKNSTIWIQMHKRFRLDSIVSVETKIRDDPRMRARDSG